MNSRKIAFGGVFLTCLIVLCFTALGTLPYSDGNLANPDDSNQKSAVKEVDNLNNINTQLTNGISVQQKAGTTNTVHIADQSIALSAAQVTSVGVTNVSTNTYTLPATTDAVAYVDVVVAGTSANASVILSTNTSDPISYSLNACPSSNGDGYGGNCRIWNWKGPVSVITVGGTTANSFYITRAKY